MSSPTNGSGPSTPTPASLRQAHPRARVDRLRGALRSGHVDAARVEAELDGWIDLFDEGFDPSLLVLILELLERLPDERVTALARRATKHRGDGVRLEALRILMDRCPDEVTTLAAAHRADFSLEVRLLLVERLAPLDRATAIERAFELLDEESGGPRMMHALERVSELAVEIGGEDVLGRLHEALDAHADEDDQKHLAWAITELERR